MNRTNCFHKSHNLPPPQFQDELIVVHATVCVNNGIGAEVLASNCFIVSHDCELHREKSFAYWHDLMAPKLSDTQKFELPLFIVITAILYQIQVHHR